MSKPALIRKVREEFGALSNMSHHAVHLEGQKWPTTEALFQSLRFDPNDKIREDLRQIVNPMQAKMLAKKHVDRMVVEMLSEADLDNMRVVLALKYAEHQDIRDLLLATEDRQIIEDCSKRRGGSGLFWGAAELPNGEWVGENWLGRLWMELRELKHGG